MKMSDALNQEEIDNVSSELTDGVITDMAVWSAVRKLDDIEAGAGDLPKDAVRGCQKCGEEIAGEHNLAKAFGHFYHEGCIP